MNRSFAKTVLAVLLIALTGSAFSQPDKQKELEEKRRQLQREIHEINTLLTDTRTKEKSVLGQVDDIAHRIRARQELIDVTTQQANLLTNRINANMAEIDKLRRELTELKKRYADLIVKTHKSRSQQNRLMFLLSSENFWQAYKRAQYMRQYATYRRKQGEEIQEKTVRIQERNRELAAQQRDKQKLIDENRMAQTQLREEKLQQEKLVATLRKNESSYAAQIREKQRQSAAIDREIEALIRAAIAEENRKTGAKAETAGTTETFAMTAEAKALAANFTGNKGKLPWPVERGVVVTRFGSAKHPTLPNVTTYSSGVEIATEEGANARASFEGEVLAVTAIRGANKAVQIRHGNYITVYQNLTDVYVRKGDKVKTRQNIGKAYTDPTTGKTILKFLIFQDTTKLNPAEWVYQM